MKYQILKNKLAFISRHGLLAIFSYIIYVFKTKKLFLSYNLVIYCYLNICAIT